MEVKPVITVHGEVDLINAAFLKTLQTKLKALQRDDYSKEEKAFASFCQGLEFRNFREFYRERCQPSYVYYVHREPCLHTFWTGCYDVNSYNTSIKPMIDHWIADTTAINDDDKLAIVYCVTAEVRSKRPRLKGTKLGGKYETIEELIVKDYRSKCSITNIRFASADPSRITESFNAYAVEVNRLALNNFLSRVSIVNNELREKRIRKVESEEVYVLMCKKLSLCVCYEMIRDPLQASTRYASIHDDLEFAMTVLSQKSEVPSWLSRIQGIVIHLWNYPSLLDTRDSWKYLNSILDNSAHILHIWTFLFVRRILTLCGRGLVNEVYKCCIGTLHCTARLINTLKLSLPPGVFNSWAYMSCLECVESMMAMIDPEVLANTSSSSLILVRAELWHYAWEKLRSIGLLCHLMPGSQVPVTPNDSIIQTICSGITTLSPGEEVSANDQGARLVEVLQSKEKYKNAFMSLGEMVIGAFKHAGRRRMAFSIGTRMADFHKEVGMVKEAEQLLCDVTSLHSVQHWPQLSSSAYSILAHCQHKLKQEDKQVNSLLVLVTTPSYDNSTHDPAHYMDQLIYIAERSKYQKLLSWEPLFDLESISFPPNCIELQKGEEISFNITFNYSGPKAMNLTVVSAILEPDYQIQSVATVTSKQFSFKESLETFEEIDLEPGPPEELLLASRPVGGDRGSKLHKVYYSSSDLTGGEGVVRSNAYQLTKMGVTCQTGLNSVCVKGKISNPGRYFIQQIILKSGALDFCLVVPTATSELHPLTILPDKVNISVGLRTQQDIILSGVPTQCELEITTGNETTINEGAELMISAPPTVQLESLDDDPSIGHQLTLSLPSLSQCTSELCFPFDMTVPSLYQTTPPSIGCHSNQDEGLLAWKFELEVYCNWLAPPHAARLPLLIYEPFSFTHRETSAGESTFLQIVMVNSCPLPLILEGHSLTGQPKLLPLNGNASLPGIFYPGESFSFLWQNRKTIGVTNTSLSISNASLRVYYHPVNNKVTDNIKTPSRTAEYNFSLSNMDILYQLKVSVEPVLPLHPIATHQHVFITYTLSNITRDFRDSAQLPHPHKLHYTIQADPTHWSIGSTKKGVVEAPGIAQSVSFRITATPKVEGHLATPICTFTIEKHSEGGGEGEKIPLTNAQFYDTSQQQYIAVAEGTGRPF